MKIMLCCIATSLLVTSCAFFPHGKRSVEYASEPFQWGTNGAQEINCTLPHADGYRLYMLMDTSGIPKTQHAPGLINLSLHVVVVINGQRAIDKKLERLQLNNISTDHSVAAYTLAVFSTTGEAVVRCRMEDQSDGRIQSNGSINLQRMARPKFK